MDGDPDANGYMAPVRPSQTRGELVFDNSEFIRFLEDIDFKNTFWGVHYDRYVESGRAISLVDFGSGRRQRALELGTSWVFPTYLLRTGLFTEVFASDFSGGDQKILEKTSPFDPALSPIRTFNLNLEADPIPCEDGSLDLIICFELLEHLDVDPMFMMAEINRVLRVGGKLVLSTPNSTSSQIIDRILHGYSPQFYMFYQKDRSPYRHNFEYAPHQLRQLMSASGLEIDTLWTCDTFGPPSERAMALLEANDLPQQERGDNMFVIASKTSGVLDRYPNQIYDVSF